MPGHTNASPDRRRLRSVRLGRRAAVISAGVVVGLGAGGVALAATGSGGTTAVAAPGTPNAQAPARAGHPGHRGHPHPGQGELGRGLHGEFTVPKAGGGSQTLDSQRGVVTVVSGSALSVKSSDGHLADYTLQPTTAVDAARDGIASVKTGDKVAVLATNNGGKLTVVRVTDMTQGQAARKAAGLGAPGGQMGGPGKQMPTG